MEITLFFPLFFLKTPYVGTSVGFWLCPTVDSSSTHRQWHSSSFHRQSLPWEILPSWNFCVGFGDSIIMPCSFWCHHSQAYESGKLWDCWNCKPRAWVWLVRCWNSWWLSRALCSSMAGKCHADIVMSWTCVSRTTGQDWESLFSWQAGEGSSNTHIDPSVPYQHWLQQDVAFLLLTDFSEQFPSAFNW